MAEESKAMAAQVENTKKELFEKIDRIGDEVKETFNLKNQVEKHPLEAIGGATLAGFVLGSAVLGTSGKRWNEWLAKFDDEIDFAKTAAFGFAAKKICDIASEAFPGFAPQIREIADRVSTKIERKPEVASGGERADADKM